MKSRSTVPQDEWQLRWFAASRLSDAIRFRELVLADWAFRGLPSPTYASRPLFGYTMSLDLSRSSVQRLLYLMGERFIAERTLLERLVRPGMCVVDVGANIGYYLLLVERLIGPQGHAICIEPSPENLVELHRNIEANAFENVVVHDFAVGATSGHVGVRGGINSGVVNTAHGIADVRLETLDRLLDTRVDLIKIDVDGYEGKVLEGSLEVLRRQRPALFLEVHPHLVSRFGYSTERLMSLLRGVYSRFEAWEAPRPDQTSLWRKLGARYFGRSSLVQWRSLEELLAASDAGRHDWTFWLICLP